MTNRDTVTRILKRGAIAIVLLCTSLVHLSAANTIVERSSNTEFDKSVSMTHKGQTLKLEATGASLRRKWFVKGYAVAHYMQNPVKGDQEVVINDIFTGDKAKQITMIWLHKLPLSLIREGFQESLQKTFKENDYTANKADIRKFLNFFKADAQVGDVTVFRWFPGGYLELYNNDERLGTIVNADLAKALWAIWLGPDSVVNRKQMISLITPN